MSEGKKESKKVSSINQQTQAQEKEMMSKQKIRLIFTKSIRKEPQFHNCLKYKGCNIKTDIKAEAHISVIFSHILTNFVFQKFQIFTAF